MMKHEEPLINRLLANQRKHHFTCLAVEKTFKEEFPHLYKWGGTALRAREARRIYDLYFRPDDMDPFETVWADLRLTCTEERQEWRETALCFLVAMIETKDFDWGDEE
jgi:hypothetical protein